MTKVVLLDLMKKAGISCDENHWDAWQYPQVVKVDLDQLEKLAHLMSEYISNSIRERERRREMRYYICELTNKIGEYEVDAAIRFQTDKDPDEYADGLAKVYWGTADVYQPDEGTYYFNGGQLAVFVSKTNKITKATFDSLNGIITEL